MIKLKDIAPVDVSAKVELEEYGILTYNEPFRRMADWTYLRYGKADIAEFKCEIPSGLLMHAALPGLAPASLKSPISVDNTRNGVPVFDLSGVTATLNAYTSLSETPFEFGFFQDHLDILFIQPSGSIDAIKSDRLSFLFARGNLVGLRLSDMTESECEIAKFYTAAL